MGFGILGSKAAAGVLEDNKDKISETYLSLQARVGQTIRIAIRENETSATIIEVSNNFGERVHLWEANATKSSWHSVDNIKLLED